MSGVPAIACGPGAVGAVVDIVARLAARHGRSPRGVLVVGAGFAAREWSAAVRAVLRPLRLAVLVHHGATTPHSVSALARRLREEGAEVAVALGGGSVLDAAKAAAALAGCDGISPELVVACCGGQHPVPVSGVPVIAVPTTVGTGAEATPFATIWDRDSGRKLSLGGPAVRPAAAVLDPDLLAGLGLAELASGLLDTLCQGAEAAWSIRASAQSAAWGLAALGRAGAVMDRLPSGGLGADGRAELQRAGHYSGRAIALAQTSSCHAISYPLTLRLSLPHGHACGVSLGPMLRYNAAVTQADCADQRGARHVRGTVRQLAGRLGGTPATAAVRVERFLAGCGLARYDELPLPPETVAAEALSYPRCHDNPRRLDDQSLSWLLSDPSAAEEMCG